MLLQSANQNDCGSQQVLSPQRTAWLRQEGLLNAIDARLTSACVPDRRREAYAVDEAEFLVPCLRPRTALIAREPKAIHRNDDVVSKCSPHERQCNECDCPYKAATAGRGNY